MTKVGLSPVSMQGGWWLKADEIVARCAGRRVVRAPARRYRFADGHLLLDCDDEPLARRFQDLYADGSDDGAGCKAPVQVECVVHAHDPTLAAAIFRDPQPLDAFAFCRYLFPNRGFVEGPAGAGGWRTISLRETPGEPQIALCANLAVVDRRQAWQPFMASYAMNRVLRLQREVLFFHAASIGIAGRGVLIVGPKGAGKTTTALTLAARGHDFFGDELAAVRCTSKAMLPFRRAVSIRAGPRAQRVEDCLARVKSARERFPDGTERTLVDIRRLFPQAGVSPATLSCVLFLRQFAKQPVAQRFTFGLEHFPMLSPLACSMWGVPAGARIMDVSRLLHHVECYLLDLGNPDETADLVERIAYGATSIGDRRP
jgi:hypothetical protein